MNSKNTMEEQELLELLKDYPVPEAQAGFYDQADEVVARILGES